MDSCEKSPIKIYGNDSLSTRVAAFQKKAEEHQSKQSANPFSHSGSVAGMTHPKWDKDDPRYGRPAEGSKTEQRGREASAHIGKEVLFLCEMINEYGRPNEDGTASITFGELFQIYTRISNKVVGILMRGRRFSLLYFEGEMLYQSRDDDVVITLSRPLPQIRELFSFAPQLPLKRKHDDETWFMSAEDY